MELIYVHHNEEVEVLASMVTNYQLSVEEFLTFSGINMDEVAQARGWDDWDYNALQVRPIPIVEKAVRKDIMVDIETLGTKEGASIFQIAAMSFDITTGETFDSINLIGDIEKYPSLKVDGSTLKWWLNTNKELLTNLLNNGSLTEEEMKVCFHQWILKQDENVKNIYLWGNGILFDNVKLQSFLSSGDLSYPIHYRNDRDVRTLLELASLKSGLTENEIKDSVRLPDEVKHDAFDDVLFQIRLAHKCYAISIKGDASI